MALLQQGSSSTPWFSGCFPLEERRAGVTVCRQQTQVSGVKLPSKTPGPRKVLISGLWNMSRIWEHRRERVSKMQCSDSVR